MVMGPKSNSRQRLYRQCCRPYGRQVEPPACRNAASIAATCVHGQQRGVRPAGDGFPAVDRGNGWPAVGSDSSGSHLPLGTLLYVPPRPCPRSSVFIDPGRSARRGPSPNRQAARDAHCARGTRGGDLRDRQPAQPRRAPHRVTGRTRAGRRAEPDRRQAREGLVRLRLRADVSHRRRGAVAGGRVGAPAGARLRVGAAPGRL